MLEYEVELEEAERLEGQLDSSDSTVNPPDLTQLLAQDLKAVLAATNEPEIPLGLEEDLVKIDRGSEDEPEEASFLDKDLVYVEQQYLEEQEDNPYNLYAAGDKQGAFTGWVNQLLSYGIAAGIYDFSSTGDSGFSHVYAQAGRLEGAPISVTYEQVC